MVLRQIVSINTYSNSVVFGIIDEITGDLDTPSGATIIDGTGKFLVPGLAEMHAHIPVPRDGDRSVVDDFLDRVMCIDKSKISQAKPIRPAKANL